MISDFSNKFDEQKLFCFMTSIHFTALLDFFLSKCMFLWNESKNRNCAVMYSTAEISLQLSFGWKLEGKKWVLSVSASDLSKLLFLSVLWKPNLFWDLNCKISSSVISVVRTVRSQCLFSVPDNHFLLLNFNRRGALERKNDLYV